MDTKSFNDAFWDQFDTACRPRIEEACRRHLARMRCNSVDLDDMVSWASCRVWKMIDERPNELIVDGLSVQECADRIANASAMLARWAYLALVRKGTRIAEKERSCDMERIRDLAVTRSSTPEIERSESTRAAIDALRARLSADLRGKLAASWKEASDRERVAMALDANRDRDIQLRETIAEGEMKINTVEKMRSRSLHRSRDIMKSLRRNFAALLLGLSVAVIATSNAYASGGDDDGGEQTGGRNAVIAE